MKMEGEYKFKAVVGKLKTYIELGYDDEGNLVKLPLIYPSIEDSYSFVDLFNAMKKTVGNINPEKAKELQEKYKNNTLTEEDIEQNANMISVTIDELLPKINYYFVFAIEKEQNEKMSSDDKSTLSALINDNIDIILPRLSEFLTNIFGKGDVSKKLLRVAASKIE
jgi:hypothetical protein